MQTLDQKRARFAWGQATANSGSQDRFVKLAKGAPALIMGNGLMPALAFWQSKDDLSKALVGGILGWLAESTKGFPRDYRGAMAFLYERDSREYMRATEESLEYLKWLRHFAASL